MSEKFEIIDLTSPKSPLAEIPETEADSRMASSQKPANQEQTRGKRRKNKRKSVTDTPTKTPRGSRSNSEERAAARVEPDTRLKRKRKNDELEDREESAARRVHKEIENSGNQDAQDLFFVDLVPASIPSARQPLVEVAGTGNVSGTPGKLLVPAHVTVLGSTPVEIIQPLSESEGEEDFIDYLDYEDTRHIVRYYDDAPNETAVLNRTVCKNCGAEGEHKTSACTVQICLTCGVRNEHSTRSCPISKVCFTCGMKGHINANCPNRRTARALQSSRELECERCSSSRHKTNECPTLWRMYEYLSVEEQSNTLALRQSKKDLKLGQGGEGYVADDEWCYNCGDSGHWGDDCEYVHRERWPEDHSAFSIYNITAGPFYDSTKQPKASTSRSRVRDWENGEDPSGWGKGAPDNVGRQGRMKSRVALEKQARQIEDDPDDWFGNNAGRRNDAPSARASARNSSKPTFTFGKGVAPGRHGPPADSGPPSLLSRMGEPSRPRHDNRDRDRSSRSNRSHHSASRSDKRDHYDDSYGSGYDSRRRRDDRSSSKPFSDRRRHDSGPRYKGGYVAR